MLTLVGRVSWRRRMGRCPRGCHGSQQAPLDQTLGIEAYQQTSDEIKRLGCLLAVLLPYDLAAWLLKQLSGIVVSDDSLWQWVQVKGVQARQALQRQLSELASGQLPSPEPLPAELAELPLVIAADGVKIPFRPNLGTPRVKLRWREVKVAILARLGDKLTRTGKQLPQLYQRRVVAVLDDIHAFEA